MEAVVESLKWGLRAAAVVLVHLVVVVLLITAVWVAELWVHWLWGDGDDPRLFDALPLKWLFHAIDLGIIGVFFVQSLREAYATLERR